VIPLSLTRGFLEINIMRNSLALILAVAFPIACGPKQPDAADTARARADSPQLLSSTPGFRTPESVRYDPDLDVFFISNIDGNPSMADNNGYIARVHAESTSAVSVLARGGEGRVTLNAPKGMVIVGDTLWVADIDVLRGFHKRTGRRLAEIELRGFGASFLNDVTVDDDGALYVTDTGIRFDASGAMSASGTGRVYQIVPTPRRRRAVTELARGDTLARPNGITWDPRDGKLIVVPFGGREIQAWRPGDTAPTVIGSGPGQYDGVEVLSDGRILVSSWADSAVHVLQDRTLTPFITGVAAPADFGIDTKRRVLALPRFMEGVVQFWRIP
jgi:sugar lactone lactonase YvrE